MFLDPGPVVNGVESTYVVTRRALAILFVVATVGLLAGCASRPESGFLLPVAESGAGASSHVLLVATTRERDDRPGTLFNGDRAKSLDYAEAEISIPPNHQAGMIEWPSTPPGNPATNFVVRQSSYLQGDKEFVRALNAELAKRPRGGRKVLVFIHGYNTMFAEGLYRFAQIDHDSKSDAVPVLFTWASRGNAANYVYDTNSATAARDDLDHTLRLLFASDADTINIVAHSMGNWVTVEALRQIKISGRLPPLRKLGAVVLAAPDIDLDVFKSQMRSFGKPRKPFYIVLSKDDRALGLSKFIAGGKGRLGSDADIDELTALGAVVIDLTDLQATDASNHTKFAQLAEVAPQLAAVLNNGVAANPGSAPGDGSLGSIVTLPITLLGAPVSIAAGQ